MTMLAPSHEQTAGAHRAPSAETIYRALRGSPTEMALDEPFTAHVVACALTIAVIEASESGESVCASLGLGRAGLAEIASQWAPAAFRLISLDDEPETTELDEEEAQLRALLDRFKVDSTPLGGWMSSIVARRAMSPRHLWQDLGLLERSELTRLMGEWFPTLAAANNDNMKWKKFFYRKLCELEGFSLCAAPTCRECADFDNCFGEEDGASVLSRIARR